METVIHAGSEKQNGSGEKPVVKGYGASGSFIGGKNLDPLILKELNREGEKC